MNSHRLTAHRYNIHLKKLGEDTINEEINALTLILIQMNDDSEVEFIMNNMSHFAILTEMILTRENSGENPFLILLRQLKQNVFDHLKTFNLRNL